MEKELGRIKKNDSTDIIIRIDEYKGKKGLTIREYVKSERYTGFSKAGTRIPVDSFIDFRDIINKVDYNELSSPAESSIPQPISSPAESSIPQPISSSDVTAVTAPVKKVRKPRKKKEEVTEVSTELPDVTEEQG